MKNNVFTCSWSWVCKTFAASDFWDSREEERWFKNCCFVSSVTLMFSFNICSSLLSKASWKCVSNSIEWSYLIKERIRILQIQNFKMRKQIKKTEKNVYNIYILEWKHKIKVISQPNKTKHEWSNDCNKSVNNMIW